MTEAENEELSKILFELMMLTNRLKTLPGHRATSLAITKLEEGRLWIQERRTYN